MKVMFAASSGGHLEQLLMLRPLMKKYEGFLVTEKTKYSIKEKDFRVYYLKQINREEILFLPKLFWNTILSLYIIIRERPKVMITTGVLMAIPAAVLLKIVGGKLVYIESFAKIDSPTMSGKFLYKFADQFYVQWEEMLEIFPNAIFKGGIY